MQIQRAETPSSTKRIRRGTEVHTLRDGIAAATPQEVRALQYILRKLGYVKLSDLDLVVGADGKLHPASLQLPAYSFMFIKSPESQSPAALSEHKHALPSDLAALPARPRLGTDGPRPAVPEPARADAMLPANPFFAPRPSSAPPLAPASPFFAPRPALTAAPQAPAFAPARPPARPPALAPVPPSVPPSSLPTFAPRPATAAPPPLPSIPVFAPPRPPAPSAQAPATQLALPPLPTELAPYGLDYNDGDTQIMEDTAVQAMPGFMHPKPRH